METKLCRGKNGCGQARPLQEFSRKTKSRDGLQNQCKLCNKKINDSYYVENFESIAINKIEYYKTNAVDIAIYQEKYRESHAQEIAESSHVYYALNSEKIKKYQAGYRRDNPEKIRKDQRVYQRERRGSDPVFRMTGNIKRRILLALKGKFKSDCTQALLGCKLEDFKSYIELKFTEGMTWENHGTSWHLDHIQPCASFDLSDPGQQKICFHYTNLQPLGKKENAYWRDEVYKKGKWKPGYPEHLKKYFLRNLHKNTDSVIKE